MSWFPKLIMGVIIALVLIAIVPGIVLGMMQVVLHSIPWWGWLALCIVVVLVVISWMNRPRGGYDRGYRDGYRGSRW